MRRLTFPKSYLNSKKEAEGRGCSPSKPHQDGSAVETAGEPIQPLYKWHGSVEETSLFLCKPHLQGPLLAYSLHQRDAHESAAADNRLNMKILGCY